MKLELKRTIKERIDLIQDDILNSKLNKNTIWMLPKTIEIEWNKHIKMTDYIFNSDTIEDCQERWTSLLSATNITSDNDSKQMEHFPTKEEMKIKATFNTTNSTDNKSDNKTTKLTQNKIETNSSNKSNNTLYILLSILLAFIAIYVALLK